MPCWKPGASCCLAHSGKDFELVADDVALGRVCGVTFFWRFGYERQGVARSLSEAKDLVEKYWMLKELGGA